MGVIPRVPASMVSVFFSIIDHLSGMSNFIHTFIVHISYMIYDINES